MKCLCVYVSYFFFFLKEKYFSKRERTQAKFAAWKMLYEITMFIKQYKSDPVKIKTLFDELNGKSTEIFEICKNSQHLDEVFYSFSVVISVCVQILQLFFKKLLVV